MTTVAFTSVKGAPGVTTLASLVGAGWPAPRRVSIVELDPSGGDLAARFCLSSKRGWSSFAAASRRTAPGELPSIDPHLQQLPGGLEALVAPTGPGGVAAIPFLEHLLCAAGADEPPLDLVIDLGRLRPDLPTTRAALAASDTVAVVVRGDAPSALHLRDGAVGLRTACDGTLGLVVLETGPYSAPEISEFTDIPVLATVPFDPASASVASGGQGSPRRLSRSSLASCTSELATILVGTSEPTGKSEAAGGPLESSPMQGAVTREGRAGGTRASDDLGSEDADEGAAAPDVGSRNGGGLDRGRRTKLATGLVSLVSGRGEDR